MSEPMAHSLSLLKLPIAEVEHERDEASTMGAPTPLKATARDSETNVVTARTQSDISFNKITDPHL